VPSVDQTWWIVVKLLISLVIVGVGLAGCTAQGSDEARAVHPHVIVVSGPAITVLEGTTEPATANPRAACKILQEVFGSVPASELHLLPIGGAIALPGCLVGQIP
jgi:hypothetical protein